MARNKTKTEDRYLNLMGGQWAPDLLPSHFASGVMLANYLSAGVITASIVGASLTFPSMQKTPILNITSAFAGGALALFGATTYRRREAMFLKKAFETLVIDTSPTSSTPPTPPDMMGRVHGLITKRKTENIISSRNPINAALGITTAPIFLLAAGDPHFSSLPSWFCCFVFSGTLIDSSDTLARIRQFKKIANQEWIITDENNGKKEFQKENPLPMVGLSRA